MSSTPVPHQRAAVAAATDAGARPARTVPAAITVAIALTLLASLVLAPGSGASAGPAVEHPTGGAAAVAASTHTAAPQAVMDGDGVEAFVRAAYADFLGRAPSTTELRHWGPRLQSGTVSRTGMAQELARSSEWLTWVITGFYRGSLGREPDPSGLAHWITQARAGMAPAEIAARFYASDEYYRRTGGTPQTWIRALYRALLLREGEAAGVASWVATLRAGYARHEVAIGFYQSPESLGLRVRALYGKLLGRGPDPSGLRTWPPVVRDQGDLTLAAALAGSAEYFGKAGVRFPPDGAPSPWAEVVGTGTPASCTSAALAAAVRDGGFVEFDCGPDPVTITVSQTLVTCNTTTCRHPWQDGSSPVESMVLDGGGLVTLSGGGARGIFYANSCEESFGWLTSSCQNDVRPRITFRSLTFADGNAQAPPAGLADVGGGGAIAMRGGTLTVEDVTFTGNRTVARHSDWGGGAVRLFGMVSTATFTRTTFTGNSGANGGGLSSLHAPMVITDSVFTGNTATGSGASSGQGGNGGAVYFDGTGQNVRIVRTRITDNVAPEGGPAVFYVSNSRTGTLTIEGSTFVRNTGQRFFTAPFRSIFYLGTAPLPVISGSAIE